MSKAERLEIETLDKSVNETHRILFGHVVIKGCGKEHLLRAGRAFEGDPWQASRMQRETSYRP
jgi:hypothetical protein